MKAYAIEVCDRWDNWHVCTSGPHLFVYRSRAAAQEQIDVWISLEKRIGFKKQRDTFDPKIRYRVKLFNEKRIEKKKRRKPLK